MSRDGRRISLGGNLLCTGVKSMDFNLSLLGEEYTEKIFDEEKERENVPLAGFVLKSESDGSLTVYNGRSMVCVLLPREKSTGIAFFSVFRRKAREEMNCDDCARKCMIIKVLSSKMEEKNKKPALAS